ncbi:PREDICTED: protein PLASTID MOVEMENT IMPAIRED 1-RELATED 1-like isoform X2 [Ipomoea nil]|uniref:protein PLASTID MOVEMENT IMPAIRED 1-RELATED 1-like isoform X2 n=1 Tax=Ipomoea nil TaxID=35883 RepID=UPI000900AB10|nr:PREDICTED: protein PLASTID MOVEMENT IMPAIRED 1-RELATED 1-like isoform X2 [Ipomoea nil]
MSSKFGSGKSGGGDRSGGRLLRDIEEISKALYVHKTPPKALVSPSYHGLTSMGNTRILESKSNSVTEDLSRKNKKSSIWNWKPLKALAHLRNQRFNCCFYVHVHAIEGLPVNFNDLSLCVKWKRKDAVLITRSAHVCCGTAEFGETLMHQCSVHGSRSGPQHSAKYEPKLFLLQASVIGAPALDIGKHWVDLTRLLPLTLEELEEGKRSSGKWTTSFKLLGKAKGAMLNVSFGFTVYDSNSAEPSHLTKFHDHLKGCGPVASDRVVDCDETSGNSMLRRVVSVPHKPTSGSHMPSHSLDANGFKDIFGDQGSELDRSVTFLYQKLEEGKLGNLEDFSFFLERLESMKAKSGSSHDYTSECTTKEFEGSEFSMSELGIEVCSQNQLKTDQGSLRFNNSFIETIDVTDIFQDYETAVDENTECNLKQEVKSDLDEKGDMDDSKYEETDEHDKDPMIEELESIFLDLLSTVSAEPVSSADVNKPVDQSDYFLTKSSYKASKRAKSLSLDDVAESVANDFLDMLGIEDSLVDVSCENFPDSPRENLLKQFEKENLSSMNSIFFSDKTEDKAIFTRVASTGRGRVACSDDFDLSVVNQEVEKGQTRLTLSIRNKRNVKMLENLETEALMNKWGLNEQAFQTSPHSSSGGFGSPIYLPHEESLELPPLGEGLGPTVRTENDGFLHSMNPLLFRSAKNAARLIMQVSCSVVLPAVMGSSVMEILECWASKGIEKFNIQANKLMPLDDITGKTMHQIAGETGSRSKVDERFCIPTEVENYSFDQCSINLNSSSRRYEVDLDYVSPEDLVPLALTKVEPLTIEGLRIQSDMSDSEAPSCIRHWSHGVLNTREASGLQHENLKENDGDIDELVNLSLSLDEWMRLDAGCFNDELEITEQLTKILAAHSSAPIDLSNLQLARDDETVDSLGQNYGLLNRTFTLALRVQLRDPFRDAEMVGTPMLVLIQVERSYPLEEHIHVNGSEKNFDGEEDSMNEHTFPRFRISEIHVAGLNVENSDEKICGMKRHKQSGSRWLLSSGIGRMNKHPFSTSNAIVKSSLQLQTKRKTSPGDILWSVELASLNIHVRNPDIIFPKESCPENNL